MYRTLNPDKIVSTIAALRQRIEARFPSAGLGRVCAELEAIAGENRMRASRLAKPNIALRLLSAAILAGGIGLLLYVGSIIGVKRTTDDLFGVMQGIEASVNLLIVVGAAMLFLVTLESRWKRHRALSDLHELRSIVHVIDMHQLTKDPSSLLHGASNTTVSPKRTMTPFELVRYLDYCSEMLSLTAKVAALYAQSSRDPVVVATAGDIGQITTNMSEKIWQKITIVTGTMAPRAPSNEPELAEQTASAVAAHLEAPPIAVSAAASPQARPEDTGQVEAR